MAAKRPPNQAVTTPSGFSVEYWASTGLDGQPQQRRYAVNGERVTNVTSITGQFDKPAMLKKAVALTREGQDYEALWKERAEAGTKAHDELIEKFLQGGAFPDVADGYFKAGARWFIESGFQLIEGEVMVASVEHGYAGRFDLLGTVKTGETIRADFKTQGEWKLRKDGTLWPPYPEHEVQLQLYEIAAVESGYRPSDAHYVVRLGPNGEYDATKTVATPDDALAYINVFKSRKAHEQRQRGK